MSICADLYKVYLRCKRVYSLDETFLLDNNRVPLCLLLVYGCNGSKRIRNYLFYRIIGVTSRFAGKMVTEGGAAGN